VTTSHIGIAAVSAEGAALFYRHLNRWGSEHLPAGSRLRVTLHAEPLPEYLEALERNDWHAVSHLLRRSADVLARAGAGFCVTPDNAIQYGVQLIEGSTQIPWVTMTDLVGEALGRDARQVVGLIGTKLVTAGSAYQSRLGLRGIQVLTPDGQASEDLDRIIFNELLYGQVRPESQRRVMQVIDELAARGCEAVIVGCSEGSLMVTPEASPLPVYDTVQLLARGAVERAVAGAAE